MRGTTCKQRLKRGNNRPINRGERVNVASQTRNTKVNDTILHALHAAWCVLLAVLHALHAAWCVLLAVRRMFYGVVNTRDVQSLPMEGTWNAQWAQKDLLSSDATKGGKAADPRTSTRTGNTPGGVKQASSADQRRPMHNDAREIGEAQDRDRVAGGPDPRYLRPCPNRQRNWTATRRATVGANRIVESAPERRSSSRRRPILTASLATELLRDGHRAHQQPDHGPPRRGGST
jgi:hypothetical protein